MPIGDLARSDVVTASPDTLVEELAATMREHDVGSVVITEGDEPIGIVTDRDLTVQILAEGRDVADHTAGDVITGDLYTIREEEGFYRATELMSDNAIRRLPVCDETGALTGILTVDDLTELLAEEQEHLAEVVRAQRPPY